MIMLRAFVAGFLSTLLFHQGLLALLHASGASPRRAYSMQKVPPIGVPSVVSLAFWGGVWGILLWLVLTRLVGSSLYWVAAIAFGAILPSIVALFVVMPLKGMPMGGGGNPKLIVGALILNAAWGLGVALLMRFLWRAGG